MLEFSSNLNLSGVSGAEFSPQESIITATEGQTEFSATFNIYTVLVNQVEFTNTVDYSDRGSSTITFDTGVSAGTEVKLKNS